MKAMRFTTTTGGLEKNLTLDSSTPLPPNATALREDSTLIKVAYSSPNPVDYKLPETTFYRRWKMTLPAIACGDFAGTVVASTLPHLQPRDRVFGRADPPAWGALAEYLLVTNPEGVVKLPDNVSMRDGATFGVVAITAYQCLAPYVRPGSKVLINGGSGGTGTYGIQIAKVMGCSVTVTCSGPNVQLCKDLGADEVIDYRATNVVEYLKQQGMRYDHIIDNVNSPEIYFNAHNYMKPEGIFILIAGSPSLSQVAGLTKMFVLPAWLGGGKRQVKFVGRKSNAEEYAKIVGWMSEGKVKAVVEKEYAIEEAGDAFARLKSGRVKGKLVIKVAQE